MVKEDITESFTENQIVTSTYVTIPETTDITTENIEDTKETTEMKEWDFTCKEDEITKIFMDNKEDFEKIERIITENYPYFRVRYEGDGHQYNEISGGKDYKNATDDIIEIDYILGFMVANNITVIDKPEIGAVNVQQIIFYVDINDANQGIKYIYEPEDDSYYDERNAISMSILRRIEGNWFFSYSAPPDYPIDG